MLGSDRVFFGVIHEIILSFLDRDILEESIWKEGYVDAGQP